MKKFLLLCLPFIIYASNFQDIIKSIDSNRLLHSKENLSQMYKKIIKSKEAKNYPSIDMNIKAIRLKDTPSSEFDIPGFPPLTLPVGTKTNLSFEISVTYPIFTGYAITNSIEKAKLQYIKSKLEKDELKRELYIKTVSLYGYIFATNMAINATKEALKSINRSYKKAKGLYKNGFINPADLYNIEAKKYEIEANLDQYKNKKTELINSLNQITNLKTDVKELPKISFSKTENEIIKTAFAKREDLQAIKTSLKIDDTDIKLSKSGYYPQVALFGAFKKEGDDLSFDGNGYQNADQSYIGASFKWNLFDGYEKDNQKEAMILKKNAQRLYFNDYKKSIVKDIKNSFSKLHSLQIREKAAQKELEAKKSYLKLTKGRFENALSSADELSRAIANLAEAEAKLKSIKAEIFIQKCTILLEGGNSLFLKSIL